MDQIKNINLIKVDKIGKSNYFNLKKKYYLEGKNEK